MEGGGGGEETFLLWKHAHSAIVRVRYIGSTFTVFSRHAKKGREASSLLSFSFGTLEIEFRDFSETFPYNYMRGTVVLQLYLKQAVC